MNELIFGKDKTLGIVGVEPTANGACVLFVQNEAGEVVKTEVASSRWILYAEQHSPKMQRLEGDQHYKWLMEYPEVERFEEVLRQTRQKRLDHFIARDPKEAFMLRSGVTMFKGMKVKDTSVLSFDLEHTYGVGDHLKRDGKLLLISNTFRDPKGNIKKRLFSFDEFLNEKTMINEWCRWVCLMDPAIIVGHNLFGHDFKILRHASARHGARLNLGREGHDTKFDPRVSMKRKDGSQAYEYHNAHIYGREIVDTFFLALTFDIGRNYESYGLKAIIKHEKLERQTRTHYDASLIGTNYADPNEWTKIKAYCEDDSDDALALFDLMIPAFFYQTQSVPRGLQLMVNSATGSQVNSLMVRGYLQQSHSIAKASPAVDYEGAISFGIPGVHRNVLRFDVSSLYPSIIRQFRVYCKEKDPQELFLKMVNYFTEERLKNKKTAKETGDRYYKDLEQSQKIMINSAYGFLGAGRVNYNFPEGAAEVTRRGRDILKHAIKWATGKEYQSEVEIETN
jgi:DNA polymerase, archaea type